MKGIVTDIQRFSIHDGPGIRTTVFLKGCNMRCPWCHNPETLNPEPELRFFPDNCIACEACLGVCRRGAHEIVEALRVFHRDRCEACGACAAACYADALILVGREMPAEEVLAEVAEDREFYKDSGGGVTLSGGEPLCQLDFSRAILELCRAEGIHTAIETNAAWPWQHVASVLPVTDLVMIDVKLFDDDAHRRWTGVSNRRVLDNVRRLSRQPQELIVRTPVIPGVNDTVEEIGRIAELIAGFGNLLYYELLPYHPLGTGKYESLGMQYSLAGLRRPEAAELEGLAEAARKHGVSVRVAGRKQGLVGS